MRTRRDRQDADRAERQRGVRGRRCANDRASPIAADNVVAATVVLDLRVLIELTSPPPASFSFMKPGNGTGPPSRDELQNADTLPPEHELPGARSPQQMALVRAVLPAVLQTGLHADVDAFVQDMLGYAVAPACAAGLCRCVARYCLAADV